MSKLQPSDIAGYLPIIDLLTGNQTKLTIKQTKYCKLFLQTMEDNFEVCPVLSTESLETFRFFIYPQETAMVHFITLNLNLRRKLGPNS